MKLGTLISCVYSVQTLCSLRHWNPVDLAKQKYINLAILVIEDMHSAFYVCFRYSNLMSLLVCVSRPVATKQLIFVTSETARPAQCL